MAQRVSQSRNCALQYFGSKNFLFKTFHNAESEKKFPWVSSKNSLQFCPLGDWKVKENRIFRMLNHSADCVLITMNEKLNLKTPSQFGNKTFSKFSPIFTRETCSTRLTCVICHAWKFEFRRRFLYRCSMHFLLASFLIHKTLIFQERALVGA